MGGAGRSGLLNPLIERRLFVAIELPDAVTEALAAVQPAPRSGIRLVDPAEMHLTLHFRGAADITETVYALRTVAPPRFSLTLTGVGRFVPREGDIPLWASVAESTALTALHQQVGAVLSRGQWRVDTRAFIPHVTLAWCTRAVPQAVIDGFLARGAGLGELEVAVEAFTLYAGTEGPSYNFVRRFPLR